MSSERRRRKYHVNDVLQRAEGGSSDHCCVPFCTSSSRHDHQVSFHRFPTGSALRFMWLREIRRADLSVDPHTKVCSRHFTDSQVIINPSGRQVLVKNSVPSLFEWNHYSTQKRIAVWGRRTRPNVPEPRPESEDEEGPTGTVLMDHNYAASRPGTGVWKQYEAMLRKTEHLRQQVHEDHIYEDHLDSSHQRTSDGTPVLPEDVLQLSVCKEEPPEQQDWSSSLDQEDTEPPHIKKEQEELWIGQQREQHQELEEGDIGKFNFNPDSVKSEDEEEHQTPELHQIQTEEIDTGAGGEDWNVPEQTKRSAANRHPPPEIEVMIEGSSDHETDDSDDWKDTREDESDSVSMQDKNDKRIKTEQSTGLNQKEQLTDHTKEKPFSCSLCGKRFTTKQNRWRHIRTHVEDKSYHCSECGKSFYHKYQLKDHKIVHSGNKPFSCSECGKSFYNQYQLKDHMGVHSGVSAFNCPVCGRRFTRRNNMTKHMEVHTRKKPFSCPECGKGFSQKHCLMKHTAMHSGEKPFCCSECGKTFSTKSHLTQHMRTHTGEKPFCCSECGKRFAQQSNMAKHMRIHTGE